MTGYRNIAPSAVGAGRGEDHARAPAAFSLHTA